jgi:transcriptional regulator with XRE-family HTH domain
LAYTQVVAKSLPEVRVGGIGTRLRSIRVRWGLSLRAVEGRSQKLAEEWGNSSYEISGSWLARLEGGRHEMTVPKLLALATIYGEPPEQLLNEFRPSSDHKTQFAANPNANSLPIAGEAIETQIRHLMPENFLSIPIPENTMLLPPESPLTVTPYRRLIIGQKDLALAPMIKPGSIVKIDTTKQAIASRKEWTNDYDRAIYLVLTHDGYFCTWCDLDPRGIWLTLVAHPLSTQASQRWRYKREVDIIGRAIAVTTRLPP